MPKTRTQIATELGISPITLWRKLKSAPFNVNRGLIYPPQENKIKLFITNPCEFQHKELFSKEKESGGK